MHVWSTTSDYYIHTCNREAIELYHPKSFIKKEESLKVNKAWLPILCHGKILPKAELSKKQLPKMLKSEICLDKVPNRTSQPEANTSKEPIRTQHSKNDQSELV